MGADEVGSNVKTIHEIRRALQQLRQVVASGGGDVVLKALFDANSILVANSDDTPEALTVAASRFLGRKATGNIAAMSVAEAKTLLALALSDLSDGESHASNHTDGTDDIQSATNAQKGLATAAQITALESATAAQHTQGTDQALDTGGANEITAANAKAAYTHSQVTTGNPHSLDAADVGADAAGTAAGAVSSHESTYAHGDIATNSAARHTQGTDQGLDTGGANAVTAAQAKAAYTHSGVTSGNPHSVSAADIGVEAGADVTDAANVNAAGAVMESDYIAKGDILVGAGAGTAVARSVGTDGYVLTADSAQADGLKWAAVSAPASPAIVLTYGGY